MPFPLGLPPDRGIRTSVAWSVGAVFVVAGGAFLFVGGERWIGILAVVLALALAGGLRLVPRERTRNAIAGVLSLAGFACLVGGLRWVPPLPGRPLRSVPFAGLAVALLVFGVVALNANEGERWV